MALVSSGFEQQGTVSWDAVGSQTVSFSYNFLSRCAEAGVDVRSIAVGQLIAQDFPLSTTGQRNVEKAIESLPMHRGYGGAIWFGFGINTFARTLSKTNEGCSLLALCAALSESFHEEYAAEVMHNLVSLKDLAKKLTPSIKQWLMIVRACAGTFASTKFSRIVGHIMRLHSINPQKHSMPSPRSFDKPPAPRDFADVLRAIGLVACGRLSSIRIAGGAGAAWLAAVSEWLFDLRVVVQVGGQLDADIENVYHSKSPNESAQVQVQLTDYYVHDSVELDMVKTVSTSLVLRRGTADGLPPFLVVGNPHVSPLSTRVPWHSLLSIVFGQDFKTLLEQEDSVGYLLGCAARRMQLFACDSAVLGERSANRNRTMLTAHFEHGFIESLLNTLPELTVLGEKALKASRLSRSESRKGYIANIIVLRKRCYCSNCIVFASADAEADNYEETSDPSAMSLQFCFLDIIFTILNIGFQLSEMIIAENLSPTKRGIESIYRQERKITRDMIRDHDMMGYQAGEALETARLHASIDKLCSWEGPARHLRLFTDFSTVSDTPPDNAMWAVVSSGICAYSQLLHTFSLDPSLCNKVCIIPGRIEKDDTPFEYILDKVPAWETSDMSSRGVEVDRHLDAKVQLDLVLQDGVDKLEAHYVLQTVSVPLLSRTVRFTLEEAVTLSAYAHSPIPCSGKPSICRDDRLLEMLEFDEASANHFCITGKFQTHPIAILLGGKDRYLSQATAMLGYRTTSISRIASHNECVHCCLRMVADSLQNKKDWPLSLRLNTLSSAEGDQQKSYILVVRGQTAEDWLLKPFHEMRRSKRSLSET